LSSLVLATVKTMSGEDVNTVDIGICPYVGI